MSTSISDLHEELVSEDTSFTPYQEEAGESYMNIRQQNHIRKILENKRNELNKEELRITEILTKQQNRLSAEDLADNANWEIEMRNKLRIQGKQRRLRDKVNDALLRLAKIGNRYGFCETCNNKIGMKRLEIRPTATLCVDCKTLDEIREKQNGQ